MSFSSWFMSSSVVLAIRVTNIDAKGSRANGQRMAWNGVRIGNALPHGSSEAFVAQASACVLLNFLREEKPHRLKPVLPRGLPGIAAYAPMPAGAGSTLSPPKNECSPPPHAEIVLPW